MVLPAPSLAPPSSFQVLGPHVDSRTLELLSRTLIGRAPVLDPSSSHLLVTMHGVDRPGLVADLAARIFNAGGLVSTSKMMKLGQEFAIMMHVSCDAQHLSAVIDSLHKTPAGADALSNCEIQVKQVLASTSPST